MPSTKHKKAKTPESLPNQGDPDRKRVLNVLAQRRYRQRRREKIAALEVRAGNTTRLQEDQIVPLDHLPIALETVKLASSTPSSGESEIVEDIARSPSLNYISTLDFDQDLFNVNILQDFNMPFPNLPTPIPSIPSSPSLQFPLTPDGALLTVPTLSALHAFATVATAFDIVTKIWDPTYLHILPPLTGAVASLPPNLHPITAQLTIPHHPMLDLLPWPSVREKLICMLSMPSAFRPPVAQEEGNAPTQSNAIVQLAHDLDDPQDGVGLRVHGNSTSWAEGNELVEDAWEIGELFYKKWWWCLDQRVVEVSNQRRKERGLGRLRTVV